MRRLPDWESRFVSFLDSRRNRDFLWGYHDCCVFVADAVETITGVDCGVEWRGTYANRKEALSALDISGGSMRLSLVRVLGAPRDNKLLAKRGDVAMVSTPDGNAASIVCGSTVAVVSRDGGFIQFPLNHALMVWKI